MITTRPAQTAEIRLPTVNVRKSPNGPALRTLKAGDQVTILQCVDNWCQIKDPAGWVWQGCLSNNPAGLGCEAK
jgi:SH3-like domain-containing protein